MSIINRFFTTTQGAIAITGNTLGLSKDKDTYNAGTSSSIGAFISLDNSLSVPTYGNGTTQDYTQNGSFGMLDLPNNSNILYAELVWGASYGAGSEDLSAVIDNAVQFVTPQGSFYVEGDNVTKRNHIVDVDGVAIKMYTRSANVTQLMQGAVSGNYAVCGVPALIRTMDIDTSFTNHAGWTLLVAYSNSTMPQRTLSIWCGSKVVWHGATPWQVTLDEVSIHSKPQSAKLFVSAQEGDAGIQGDQVLFGQSDSVLYTLQGANNMPNNFFASQINDSNGNLDTRGSFGDNNADAQFGINTVACRQGWDITAVSVGEYMDKGASPIVRFVSTGDLFVPNAIALQLQWDTTPTPPPPPKQGIIIPYQRRLPLYYRLPRCVVRCR